MSDSDDEPLFVDYWLTRKNYGFYAKNRDKLERLWYKAQSIPYKEKADIFDKSAYYQKGPMPDDEYRLFMLEGDLKDAEQKAAKELQEQYDRYYESIYKPKALPPPPPKEDPSEAPLTPQTVIYLFDGRAIPLDYEQDQKLREKTDAEFRKLGITDWSKVPIETRKQIEQNVYGELLDLEIERNTQKRKKRRGIAKTQGGDFSQIANDAATRYLISQAKSFSTSKTPYDVWLEEHFKGGGAADPFLL